MKVNPSVKRICDKCKVIRRNGRVMVICENPGTSSGRARRAPFETRRSYLARSSGNVRTT